VGKKTYCKLDSLRNASSVWQQVFDEANSTFGVRKC